MVFSVPSSDGPQTIHSFSPATITSSLGVEFVSGSRSSVEVALAAAVIDLTDVQSSAHESPTVTIEHVESSVHSVRSSTTSS
eukprot:3317742-Heterocapsa_arctica.AAC.1